MNRRNIGRLGLRTVPSQTCPETQISTMHQYSVLQSCIMILYSAVSDLDWEALPTLI